MDAKFKSSMRATLKLKNDFFTNDNKTNCST